MALAIWSLELSAVLGGLVVLMGVLILCICYLKKAGETDYTNDNPGEVTPAATSCDPTQGNFSFEELKVATADFAREKLIGEGGFGHVYKGMLPNGELVAVKRLKPNSTQGVAQFENEIARLRDVKHSHIVSLVGFCVHRAERLLVYKFLPNQDLESLLHESNKSINWSSRVKIALDVAAGLAFLHDCRPKILHRDIKASNILVDNDFGAKISDLGVARCFPEGETSVFTQWQGTLGYADPVYVNTGRLSEKSDVYAFGVVLLELITGRRSILNVSGTKVNLITWAKPLLRPALEEQNYDALVDPKLQKEYDFAELDTMIRCAVACVAGSPELRPQMTQILEVLKGKIPPIELGVGMSSNSSQNREKRAFMELLENAGPSSYSRSTSSDYEETFYTVSTMISEE